MTQESENAKNAVQKAMEKQTAVQPVKTYPQTMKGIGSKGVMGILETMKPSISAALPKHLTAERMIQMAATLIARNPKIAECSTQSIVGAVVQASILGFRPVDSLGQCYFVPYAGTIQFQIGYKGYIDLARRSGEIKMIYAETVHKGDRFNYEMGLNPKVEHIPDLNAPRTAETLTHVYAVAHYKDGGYNFVVMSKAQVELLRLRSPMQKIEPSGPWKTDYPAMAKAKAIKQLSKYMPMSDEMQNAVLADEAVITDKALTNDGTGTRVEEFVYPESIETTPEEGKEAPPVEEVKPLPGRDFPPQDQSETPGHNKPGQQMSIQQ